MTRYRVAHVTRYHYERRVSACHNEARLLPRAIGLQRCDHAELTVEPTPAVRETRIDYFGNLVDYFAVQTPHRELEVRATSTVDVEAAPPLPADSPAWDAVRAQVATADGLLGTATRELVLGSPFVPLDRALADYAAVSFPPGRPLLEGLVDLTGRIHREFHYDPHFTTVATPVLKVFRHRRGVCQDFAHLELACLRSLGLPARYVSGYIESRPAGDGERLTGADASHAWLAAYCPDLGWVDVDPTNDQAPASHHITLATGRDYSDVTPLKGVILGGGRHRLEVAVDVERVDAAPKV